MEAFGKGFVMEQLSFAAAFFRIYDRKINSGEITFSRIGMSKNSFTQLCTDKEFLIPYEELERLFITMKMAEEEIELLRSYYTFEDEE